MPRLPLADGPHENLRAAIATGLRYLLRTRELRVLAFSMGGYNFAFNASMAIFVLYARDLLRVPAAGYGGCSRRPGSVV
jgi:hypothetical protein